jgi:hypothetical protein
MIIVMHRANCPLISFAGTSVRVVCKLPNGETKTIGETEVKAGEEKFRVSLPREMLQEDGKQLKGECFAVLHQTHCPSRARLDKLVFGSKTVDDKHVFVPAGGVIRYSTTACLSYRKLLGFGAIPGEAAEFGNPVRTAFRGVMKEPKNTFGTKEELKERLDNIDKAKKLYDNLNNNPPPPYPTPTPSRTFCQILQRKGYTTPGCVRYGSVTKP